MQDSINNPTISEDDAEEGEERHKDRALLGGALGFLAGWWIANSANKFKQTITNGNGKAQKKTATTISGGEQEMIANITKAGSLNVDDVMVPRADMVCLAADLSLEAMVEAINKAPHTRYAVYGEDMDDILGMVHIKDVLKSLSVFTNGKASQFSLKDILRSVVFVAPSMRAMDLLLRMRLEGVHLAIVVDEYGGTDGQVALEYLVEEVIGDIRDELDSGDEPAFEIMPDGSYIVDGRYDLDELQTRIGNFLEMQKSESSESGEIDSEDIDTVGGLVMALAGRMPLVGEVIHHSPSGWEFHITHADPRHISRMRMYHKQISAEKTPASANLPE